MIIIKDVSGPFYELKVATSGSDESHVVKVFEKTSSYHCRSKLSRKSTKNNKNNIIDNLNFEIVGERDVALATDGGESRGDVEEREDLEEFGEAIFCGRITSQCVI